jgi:hypothetical protein
MEKKTTIAEARLIISTSIDKAENELLSKLNNIDNNSIYTRSVDYQNFLVELICHKWAKSDPDMFLKCWVTDDSYDTLSGAAYSWYMIFKNKANMNSFLHLRKCTDFDKIREGKEIIHDRRYQIALEIWYTQNIVYWITQNISINS